MANSRSLVLLDFDGTLFFTDRGVSLASEEILGERLGRSAVRRLPLKTKSRIYEVGLKKYGDLSVPNTNLISFIKRRREGAAIVVLTARPVTVRKEIRYLLKRGDVPPARLICRGREDLRMHDEDWKLKMIKAFSRNGRRIELFEDKVDNIKHIRSGINSDNVDFFLVKRNSIKKV